MKTKLLLLFLTSLVVLSTQAQQDISSPFRCDAPIDQAWLKPIKKEALISKSLDAPTVRVAYLIPSNRSAQELGVKALQRVVSMGHEFFKIQMTHNGLASKSFRYETEADGQTPLIHVINIPKTDAEIEGLNQYDAWQNKINAARNAGLGIWNRGEIWILVSESHMQQADSSVKVGGALGASFGSADDPGVATMESTFLTPIGRGALLDDRSYHGMIIPEIGPYPLKQGITFGSTAASGTTLSSVASVAIGAFWHELMHAFGIGPHDFRNDSNFHGNLMGNGFRGIRGSFYPQKYPNDYTRLAYVSAQVLNNSHYFNTDKQRNQVNNASLALASSSPKDGQLVFNVSASDTDGLSLLRMVGFPDYNSVELVLSGNDFNGQVATPYFEPGTLTLHRLILYDKQGNKVERVTEVTPKSGSRSPWPFIAISPAIGDTEDDFVLNAIRTRDPDNNYPLTYEWDYDNDGIFDTPQNQEASAIVNMPGGNHLIRIRTTDAEGNQTISTPVALHVDGEEQPPTEVSFTLIDTATGQAIPGYNPIPNGAKLDRSTLPPKLNIRANVPNHYESVRFDYQDTFGFRIENRMPYALFGDDKGVYEAGPIVPGDHILVATPFAKNGAKGASGTKATLRFSVVENPASFTLIDAANNQPVPGFDPIVDGVQISSQSFPKQLNIAVSVPSYYESIRFDLDGKESFSIENETPYALFGDEQGEYKSGSLSMGPHTITVIPYTENGAKGIAGKPSSITFYVGLEILGFEYSSEIYGFKEFFPLSEETHFSNLSPGPRPFLFPVTFKAITGPDKIGSVKLEIEDRLRFSHSRIENSAPYTLFGDSKGVFNSRLLAPEGIVPSGEYFLTATAYSEPNGKGIAGKPLTFTIVILFELDLFFEELRLFEAGSGVTIADFTLTEDVVIDKAITPTDDVNLVAKYHCRFPEFCPESVRFALKGPVNKISVENSEPFSLFGDNDLKGTFFGRFLPVGQYSLTITGYTKDFQKGFKVHERTVSFEIIKGGAILLKSPKPLLYPNPTTATTTLLTDVEEPPLKTEILDFSGSVVSVFSHKGLSEQVLDLSGLPKGIYFLKIHYEKEIVTKKLVKQ